MVKNQVPVDGIVEMFMGHSVLVSSSPLPPQYWVIQSFQAHFDVQHIHAY